MNMICLKCGSYFKSEKGNEICDWCEKIIETNDKFLEEKSEKIHVTDNEKKHNLILDLLHELYVAKNRDYGDSFSKTFEEFGCVMSAIRLQDKLERFKKLSSGSKQNVNDESIKDTLIDLANYAIMTIMELDKNR